MLLSEYELTVADSRRVECLALLRAWDERDPWNDVHVQNLTLQLYALINDLARPRLLYVRGGEAAAKLLRGALEP
jgi:hypothetical protein